MTPAVQPVSVPPAVVAALCSCHPEHRYRCALCRRVMQAVAEYQALADLGADLDAGDEGAFCANSLYPINALTGRPA